MSVSLCMDEEEQEEEEVGDGRVEVVGELLVSEDEDVVGAGALFIWGR